MPRIADHADGVLVDGVEDLLGRDDVAPLLHRQIARFDVEVAAELLPDHLDVGAHHQVRRALLPVFADLFAPAPFQRQPAQHHRLAGADGRHPDGAGRVVVAQVIGMEQVGHHAHAALLDRRGQRVFVLVDHVLVERLGHQLLGLGIHPGGDERRQVQPRAAVEHQLVMDEAVGGVGIHRLLGHPQRRYRGGEHAAGVGGRDRVCGHGWTAGVTMDPFVGRLRAIGRRAPLGCGRRCATPTSVRRLGRGRRPTALPRARARRRRPPRPRAAGSPAASSAPIIPDSTSPDPAVAAQDCPAGFR